MLEVSAARLDAKLQPMSHAEHDLATHFGCDGDKPPSPTTLFLSSLTLSFISMNICYNVSPVPAPKIQEGIDISPVFQTILFASFNNLKIKANNL